MIDTKAIALANELAHTYYFSGSEEERILYSWERLSEQEKHSWLAVSIFVLNREAVQNLIQWATANNEYHNALEELSPTEYSQLQFNEWTPDHR